jgi:hypothetical protein
MLLLCGAIVGFGYGVWWWHRCKQGRMVIDMNMIEHPPVYSSKASKPLQTPDSTASGSASALHWLGPRATGDRRRIDALRPDCKQKDRHRILAWNLGMTWQLAPHSLSHQPAVLFSHNKQATSNQPAVLFSHNKPAPVISHQPSARVCCLPIPTKLRCSC